MIGSCIVKLLYFEKCEYCFMKLYELTKHLRLFMPTFTIYLISRRSNTLYSELVVVSVKNFET